LETSIVDIHMSFLRIVSAAVAVCYWPCLLLWNTSTCL